MPKRLYAGLDTDGVAKLFIFDGDDYRLVNQSDWVGVLNKLGAEPGMLQEVSFGEELPGEKLSKETLRQMNWLRFRWGEDDVLWRCVERVYNQERE